MNCTQESDSNTLCADKESTKIAHWLQSTTENVIIEAFVKFLYLGQKTKFSE